MSAALPLEPIGVKIMVVLTAKALTVGKSLSEFRPHVEVEMFGELNLDLSGLHAAIDHVLNALWI